MLERLPNPSTASIDRQVELERRVEQLGRTVTNSGANVPIAALIYTYGPVPDGWLALDGSMVARASWPLLWVVVAWRQLATATTPDLIVLPLVAGPDGTTAIVRGR